MRYLSNAGSPSTEICAAGRGASTIYVYKISAPGGHAVQRNGVDKLSCQILG